MLSSAGPVESVRSEKYVVKFLKFGGGEMMLLMSTAR